MSLSTFQSLNISKTLLFKLTLLAAFVCNEGHTRDCHQGFGSRGRDSQKQKQNETEKNTQTNKQTNAYCMSILFWCMATIRHLCSAWYKLCRKTFWLSMKDGSLDEAVNRIIRYEWVESMRRQTTTALKSHKKLPYLLEDEEPGGELDNHLALMLKGLLVTQIYKTWLYSSLICWLIGLVWADYLRYLNFSFLMKFKEYLISFTHLEITLVSKHNFCKRGGGKHFSGRTLVQHVQALGINSQHWKKSSLCFVRGWFCRECLGLLFPCHSLKL